jgi:hypothetical protein
VRGPITPDDDDHISGHPSQPEYSSAHRSSISIKSPESSGASIGDHHSSVITSGNLQVLPALRDHDGNYAVPSSYDVPKTHEIHLPELNLVNCVYPLNQLVYDDMEEYLQREAIQGNKFYSYIPTAEVDLSPRTCWLLQQSFATNILPWLPLFQADQCVRHLEEAALNNYSVSNPSSLLTLFVLAIGAIISRPNDTEYAVERLAGMEYFYKGCKGLEAYGLRMDHDIPIIQCRILSSYVPFLYYS